MDKSNAYCVGVDTFQFNAGIIGFIFAMEANEKVKGVDYDYDESNLYISREMIANEDMTEIYFNAVIEKYGAKSIVTKLLDSEFDDMTIKQMKEFDGWCKRKTVENICNLLKDNELFENIQGFFKEKDEILKRGKGKFLVNNINENIKAKKYLLLGDIFLLKFPILFNKFAFLIKSVGSANLDCKQEFETQLYDTVFKPLVESENEPTKSNTKNDNRCLNCNAELGKQKIQMTYIQGVIADMSRKKSVFWGNSPDTFICPLCNMIYSFMPLGFTGIGGRALVFVNANDSVELMRQLNEIIVPEDEKDVYKVTYNSIIKKLVDIKSLHLNKMQVISKDVDNHYKISDISKDKLEIIKKGQKELQSLSYAKQGDNYINIYGEVIDNIISGKNQFSTLGLLLGLEFKYSYQLFNILKLEIYKSQLYKEEIMENKVKIAYVAKGKGEELKRKFGIEADNKLRGFAYQLLNAAHSDNNELFLDRIVRMYVGMQLPIPDIFINGFKGTEEFKTIAYAYIIGLKGEEYIKSEGKTNEQ